MRPIVAYDGCEPEVAPISPGDPPKGISSINHDTQPLCSLDGIKHQDQNVHAQKKNSQSSPCFLGSFPYLSVLCDNFSNNYLYHVVKPLLCAEESIPSQDRRGRRTTRHRRLQSSMCMPGESPLCRPKNDFFRMVDAKIPHVWQLENTPNLSMNRIQEDKLFECKYRTEVGHSQGTYQPSPFFVHACLTFLPSIDRI